MSPYKIASLQHVARNTHDTDTAPDTPTNETRFFFADCLLGDDFDPMQPDIDLSFLIDDTY